MKYWALFKDPKAEKKEITKEQARDCLTDYWKPEYLADLFDNNKEFRLWTSFYDVWTENDNGMVPAPGFYGEVG